MKPSVVLLGFLLGSSAAISFGLVGVAFVFWLLQGEHPELRAEIGPLVTHLTRFVALTAFAGLSFFGLLKQRRWRVASLGATGIVLAIVVWAYVAPVI